MRNLLSWWRSHHVIAGLLVLASTLGAQPLRERRAFSHVMGLRHQLWLACRSADEATRSAVVKLTLDRSSGNPMVPLGEALARVRGVQADAAFGFRHGLQCFATPEVPDAGVGDPEEPPGTHHYPEVHLTMHAPYKIAPAGRAEFRFRILDAGGVERWRGVITEPTEVVDLMRYTTTTVAPVQDLPDGSYDVEVQTWLDGVAPRPGDPVLQARFHVRRGYPGLVRALGRRGAALEGVAARDMLALKGALASVRRAFEGEPAAGRSQAPLDLKRCESILTNLEEGKPALAGMTGWVTIALQATDDEAAMVSVRLSPRAADDPPRPLVLFVPGVPAWDHEWGRPTSPRTTAPEWLRDALQDAEFDSAGKFQLAVLESPGRFESSPAVVAAAVRELGGLLDLDGRCVLLGEREGALAVSQAVSYHGVRPAGVVLVCGGGLDRATLEQWRSTRVLAVSAREHPGNVNMSRALSLLREAEVPVRELDGDARPWGWALQSALSEIEVFVRAVL